MWCLGFGIGSPLVVEAVSFQLSVFSNLQEKAES
jgi:hypothetical protein